MNEIKMNEIQKIKVEFTDEHHMWLKGDNVRGQWISLKRFLELKNDMAQELKLLVDKNEELTKENEALKILLKNQLNESIKD